MIRTFKVHTFIAVLVAFGAVAQADTIYLASEANEYDNNQIGFAPCCGDQPGNITAPFGVGNTITFAGSGPYSLQTVDLFGYAGGATVPIEVDLYAGANPNADSFLGSATTDVTGNGWTTEVFDFSGLEVPDTLTFIVSLPVNNGSYDDAFVNFQQFTGISGSPNVGTSGDMWYGSPGSYIVNDDYAVATGAETNTLAVQFNADNQYTAFEDAAPEPSTLGLLFVAAAGFAGLKLNKPARSFSTSRTPTDHGLTASVRSKVYFLPAAC
jgi:hypothetical protein